MTNEEILEKQVEALEKLLQLKQGIIDELDAKIQRLEADKFGNPFQPMSPPFQPFQPYVPPQPVMIPSLWQVDPCTDGAGHDYNFPWHSTTPQPCKKCGKTFNSQWTTASSTVHIDDGTDSVSLTTALKK